MCTRGVWQLKSLAIRFCTRGGSSAGLRDYLETMLVPFANANPQIEISVSRLAWGKHPYVRAGYLADGEKTVTLRNYSATQCASNIQQLRDSRPIQLRKWDKPFRTTPSLQGEWALGNALDRPHTVVGS